PSLERVEIIMPAREVYVDYVADGQRDADGDGGFGEQSAPAAWRVLYACASTSSKLSATGSNSVILSISGPIAMLVTRSSITSTTTGTRYCLMSARASVNAS